MKKISLLFSIVLIGISLSAIANKVEMINAKLVAKNLYYEQVNRHDAVPYESIAITSEFTEKYNEQPVYYIFNINNNKGFVIVAADDGCYPILGFSFESSYSAENQAEEFVYWMNNRKQEIADNIQNNLQADENSAAEWQRLLSTDVSKLKKDRKGVLDVEPLITSLWDQGFPYNQMCPAEPNCGDWGGHVTVGCTATAMVQIMYYWRWPNQGQGSHTDNHHNYGTLYADFGNTTYDWNGMNNQPSLECDPVALISYHAGISIDMYYNMDGQCSSGAPLSTVPVALQNYFKYASTCLYVEKQYYTTANWNTLLQNDLIAAEPIQYAGYEPGGGGHSWVCDGYMATNYYHMNWGWSGQDNGYFYLNNLNPGGYTFNIGQQAVVHIAPDPALYPTYCTGQADVTTYDFGTIEDGSGPVADYADNANCSWLIAPDDSIQTVMLNFGRFDIATGDEVKIYDGSSASATLLGSYSGSTAPPQTTSTGPALFVTFTSDGSGTAPGFLASYNASTVAFCQTTTTLTEPSGDISDGSGLFDYRNASSCKWKILPTDAATVTLAFNNFKTQQDMDKVMIYDLDPPTLLAAYSGDYSTTPPPAVTSPSGKMMIIFNSDDAVRDEGWDASYSITVGTNDKKAFENLEIFPNPTSDFLNIRFSINENQSVKLDLVSMKGEIIYSQSLGNFKGYFERRLDLSSLTGGIYFLRITSDRGTTTTKVVVQ